MAVISGIKINGSIIPWSFIYLVNRLCGGDWDQTIDSFWKARNAKGAAGIQKYIRAGFRQRGAAIPYMLQASRAREEKGGKERLHTWFDSIKIGMVKPPAKKKTFTVNKGPESIADILSQAGL